MLYAICHTLLLSLLLSLLCYRLVILISYSTPMLLSFMSVMSFMSFMSFMSSMHTCIHAYIGGECGGLYRKKGTCGRRAPTIPMLYAILYYCRFNLLSVMYFVSQVGSCLGSVERKAHAADVHQWEDSYTYPLENLDSEQVGVI
jgi:hypothetical protein